MTPEQLAQVIWRALDDADHVLPILEDENPTYGVTTFIAKGMAGRFTVGDTSVDITITPAPRPHSHHAR